MHFTCTKKMSKSSWSYAQRTGGKPGCPVCYQRRFIGTKKERPSLGMEPPGIYQGFPSQKALLLRSLYFRGRSMVTAVSRPVKHNINSYYYGTVLWLGLLLLFCMEVFRHILITFWRFANNDITQSPYCGYDLLQITKCYYMEMSFHTTADRGEHSSHFNQGDGNGGISGPGTAPRGLFSWYLPLHL